MAMVVFIDNAPFTAAYPEIVAVHEHTTGFPLAASAMADKCFLHHYLGVYYNILVCSKQLPWNPPFYCITHGHVVGVLPSWEHTLNVVLGVHNANYDEVDTITIGAGDDANFGYMDGYMDAIDDVPATSKQKQTTADNPLLLYCRDCTVYNHLQCPTHCIKEWMGSFFIAMSLKKLGLRIQLGHATGKSCILPCKSFNDNFVLIDTNGIHKMVVDFCGCETSQTHTKQLLRMGWFPSTTVDPRTAATFQLLHHYQILSFESKASTYEFYHLLVHISDNVGLIEKPGKNLPPDWKEAPKAKQWLYSLFVAIDTNFRLKRQNILSNEVDPSLSEGWLYFIEEKKFKSHLKEHLSKTQEKSSCSNHNAMNMAETKLSQGLAATGVGTVDCA
ncbi:uncharacterized protein EDB91DRAFT_1085166 [Suillus paluster]|uniref:uncharacterized protein n=1 Tax=Suillus paluster TaxID=48578 RepID=UPI001B85B961|nr:uncharacterized protein EDB91DRAFT_1085166 [Suillus paluster]KAG1731231.1 hypothetical protein EDB91DRAFT_1085166 [Suillus paluster]